MKPSRGSAEKPHVVFVAGMGCRMSSSAMLTMLSEQCTALNLPQHAIEGTFVNNSGKLEVSPPSRQLEELEAVTSRISPERRVLLISHCIGAIASLDMLEKNRASLPNGHPDMRGLLIAPPFTRPATVVGDERVQKKITTISGLPYMETYDFSPDAPFDYDKMTTTKAVILPRFSREIQAASQQEVFMEQASSLAAEGAIGIVVPERDWNEAGVAATQDWLGPMLRVENAAHSLNVPSRSLEMQRMLCNEALEFGQSL